jgi:hypothetical protein
MNMNYLNWMLTLLFTKQKNFVESHPPISPKLSHVAILARNYVNIRKSDDVVVTRAAHP